MNANPDSSVVEMLVELACRAPSVHNSQPWRWRYADGYLDILTDRSRLLETIDPTGRQMVISCGAALDHLDRAAVTFRWTTEVDALPVPCSPEHLARVRFVHGAHPQSHEFDLLTAINRRRSDRRPFEPVPVEPLVSEHMRQAAARYDTQITVLSPEARETLAEASRLSAGIRKYDATYQAELRWWAGHSFAAGGIPPNALARRSESSNVALGRQFPEPHGVGSRAERATSVDESTVVLLSTKSDRRIDWLRCGQALSSILLEATADGLATCPLTHLTEQSGSRALVKSLAPESGVPQVLIRIGAASPAGEVPKPTPRRPMSSVLTIEGGRTGDPRGFMTR